MKILFFGDIVGQPGRQAIKEVLPKWQKKYQLDLVIANGENSAHGKGITEKGLNEILEAGIDLVTLGDHTWSQKQVVSLLENKDLPLIRPANFPSGLPGQGYRLIEIRTKKILVINLIGRVFMNADYDCPFRKADEILEDEAEQADIIIVDWHAEATAEKICLGWYLDGRVSAVLGTHTHIPTADEQILPNGTAYISDVGMVGPTNSSLGANKEAAIENFIKQTGFKYEVAQGPVEINAVLIETGQKDKIKKIQRIHEIISVD
ncbi:MAG: TIGR00282 family metallophosphoesterase [Parcubacteria group bacterium]|nr:TIGR00282 family metallophosphoesterase [Parcubacteria group bacterium]